MRTGNIKRQTKETDISLLLNLDGTGLADISTGCGFLDHMLTLFAVHGNYDLIVKCNGDTYVDYHHSVEDIGICLGYALKEALGTKAGIARYGDKILPMDESLILTSVDISGRGMLCFDAEMPTAKVGDFDTELVQEFFIAFTRCADITLHIRKICGTNTHHIIEGIFKSVARSLSVATSIVGTAIPSSKGVL